MDLLLTLVMVNVTFFIAYFYGKKKGQRDGRQDGLREGFMNGAQAALEETEKMIQGGFDSPFDRQGSLRLMENIMKRMGRG
ncbi:MAG: hypothetical protein DA446_07580 [Bacteroidetes bacterium]|jgi:hypothetical protein|nr:MAG: hypothetical protein DA446_07580 [Bacteroidota bacterium]